MSAFSERPDPMLEALRSARTSDRLTWVLDDDSESARDTRAFYATCFANLPAPKKQSVLARLTGRPDQVDSVVSELESHELLLRSGLTPTFEPSIGEKTPDLSFSVCGTTFIADVFLTHSPAKTLRDYGGHGEAWDTNQPGENRGKKIGDVLADKASKYAPLKVPLVVFIFLGDSRILSTWNVEQALYGVTLNEVPYYPDYPSGVREHRTPITGILLPDDARQEHYANISAVVACQWIDSSNEQDPTRRLHAYILHSWQGTTTLPIEAFVPFGQVVWRSPRAGVWQPSSVGAGNVVAKFLADGTLKYGQYTSTSPW